MARSSPIVISLFAVLAALEPTYALAQTGPIVYVQLPTAQNHCYKRLDMTRAGDNLRGSLTHVCAADWGNRPDLSAPAIVGVDGTIGANAVVITVADSQARWHGTVDRGGFHFIYPGPDGYEVQQDFQLSTPGAANALLDDLAAAAKSEYADSEARRARAAQHDALELDVRDARNTYDEQIRRIAGDKRSLLADVTAQKSAHSAVDAARATLETAIQARDRAHQNWLWWFFASIFRSSETVTIDRRVSSAELAVDIARAEATGADNAVSYDSDDLSFAKQSAKSAEAALLAARAKLRSTPS